MHTKFQGIRRRYVKFVSDFAVLIELKLREKGRSIEHETFIKLYANLEKSVKNKYPLETITREKIILERQFETVKLKHTEFCIISDDLKEKMNTNWLLSLIDQFSKINSIADDYLKSKLDLNSPGSKLSKVTENKGNMKIEKMPLPRFLWGYAFLQSI